MSVPPAIAWFRRDLRLRDHPALVEAAAAGDGAVVALFVLDPALLRPSGPNRRRFLAGALRALDAELGGNLVIRRGDPSRLVPELASKIGATTVVATADFAPYGVARDRAVERALGADGRRFRRVDAPYAAAPGSVRTVSGAPYRVFSAYRRAWEDSGWEPPVPTASIDLVPERSDGGADDVEAELAPAGEAGLPGWWADLPLGVAPELPAAGERAALERLDAFAQSRLADYAEERDQLGADGTSGLSPYLHFGCLHPRTVLDRLGDGAAASRFRAELAWREFYADVLWHDPASARESMQPFGKELRWDGGARSQERFGAWATGTTGYPLVDAGMRQLLAEGYMHNRARMVVASFLVKDLHLDWRLGARWFMWHLVDGDLASNQHNWQWVAGTGTDAAPFHRIFNPTLQQERFDPTGSYVRRHLAAGPPGEGQLSILGDGRFTARAPIVDHAAERREALARFDEARRRHRRR